MKIRKSDVLTSEWHVSVLAGLGRREKHKGQAGPQRFLGERGSCWAAARLNIPRTEFYAQAHQESRAGPVTAKLRFKRKKKMFQCIKYNIHVLYMDTKQKSWKSQKIGQRWGNDKRELTLWISFLRRWRPSRLLSGSASQRSCTQRKCCCIRNSAPCSRGLASVPIKKLPSWK